MNVSNFPNYAAWVQTYHQQSTGAALVVLVVLGGFVWLLLVRDMARGLLRGYRWFLVGGFYLSFIGILLASVLGK